MDFRVIFIFLRGYQKGRSVMIEKYICETLFPFFLFFVFMAG